MNVERLLRLADKLEGKGPYEQAGPIKPDKFNMSAWVIASDNQALIALAAKLHGSGVLTQPCGTAACACGHAAFDPWFQAQGLKIEVWGFTRRRYMIVWYEAEYTLPWSNWMAIERFFDLTSAEAQSLFGLQLPNEPKDVAAGIRKFVDDNK